MSAPLPRSLEGLLQLLWPSRCAACDALAGEVFCPECSFELRPAPPFGVEGAAEARACFLYEGAAERALLRLKFDHREDVGARLALLMAEAARGMPEHDLVIPVPLTRRRLFARGMNQSAVLAERIALPLWPTALRRTPGAKSQVGARGVARRAQVEGTFILTAPRAIEGRRVLVVDDVVTTGSTAKAAVRCLLAGGAKSASVLAFLRAEGA